MKTKKKKTEYITYSTYEVEVDPFGIDGEMRLEVLDHGNEEGEYIYLDVDATKKLIESLKGMVEEAEAEEEDMLSETREGCLCEGVPDPRMKVSENGIYAYCGRCGSVIP